MISLDVGCGNHKEGNVGIDINKNSEADVIADCHFLPFRDRIYSEVVSNHTLEHFTDPRKALQEQYRVLKRNGKLKFRIPRHSGVFHQFLYEIGLKKFLEISRKKHMPMMIHKWQFSREWLIRILSNLGLRGKIREVKSPLFFGHIGKLLRIKIRKEYLIEAIKDETSIYRYV